MKLHKTKLVPLLFLGIILISILTFYLTLDFRFKEEKQLAKFPIPTNSTLVSENENFFNYNTNSVSAEEGPGFSYEIKLKKDGWKMKKLEGQGALYQKGNVKVEMQVSSKHMSVKLIK